MGYVAKSVQALGQSYVQQVHVQCLYIDGFQFNIDLINFVVHIHDTHLMRKVFLR